MQLIGKGCFSKVYKKTANTVLIKSKDYAKEALSMEWHRNFSGIFPKCQRVDLQQYEMELFDKKLKPSKKNLREDQYKLYKELVNIQDSLHSDAHIRYECIRTAFTKSNLPTKVKNDILSYLDSLSNYGSDMSFEISPRNVAVKNGRLIMLDCFFFVSQLVNKDCHANTIK